MDRIIGNDFKEEGEINDANNNVCAKADANTKKTVEKKLEDIIKQSTETLNKIFDVDAQIAEMTNGNANCGDNDLYLISGEQEIWDLVGRITFQLKARLKNSYHDNTNGKGDSGSGRGEVAEVTRTPGSALGKLHRAQYTRYRD